MSRRWVTLIEIIIAIVVFSIWILTILNVIVSNLALTDKVKNNSIATFLSKEWIEIIYNIRDSNIDKWLKWNCTKIDLSYNCIEKFTAWSVFNVNINLKWYHDIKPTSTDYNDNLLYYHEWVIKDNANAPIINWFRYDHDTSNWKRSFFSRYIKFDGVYLWPEWSIWNADKLLKIESHVLYNKWTFTWDVVMESIIWDR